MKEITKQLKELVLANPEAEIVTFTHWEVCASDDWSYWLGMPNKVSLTDLYTYDERVYFEDDFNDLEERIYEMLDDEYNDDSKNIDDLSQKEIGKLINNKIKELVTNKEIEKKEKVICIYIHV